jgi:putative FmdB family regulatory protein
MNMPTYEYHCDACAHVFDEFQYINEDPLTKCPVCGKKKLRRAFGTGAAVLFKGSGFYETDYRSESYKQAAKADQESTPADKGSDGKSGTGDNGATSKDQTSKGSPAKSPKSKT